MPIEFRCSVCGKLLRTPDDTAGRQAKCPACASVVTVPDPAAPSGSEGMYEPASEYGPEETAHPCQAPSEMATGATPFAGGGAAGGIRPTPIDFTDVLARTWTIFTEQWGMCLVVVLVCGVINFVASQVASIAGHVAMLAGGPAGIGVFLLAQIAVQVFAIWITIGQLIYFLDTARGREAQFQSIFAGGPYLLRMIGADILFVLVAWGVFLAFAAIGGLMALAGEEDAAITLILAGLAVGLPIGITVTLIFFPYKYLIIDQNLGIVDSFTEARRLTSGNKLTMFGIMLVTSLVGGMIILCTCGLGLLVVGPYMILLYVVMYLVMAGQRTAADQMGQTDYEMPAAPGT